MIYTLWEACRLVNGFVLFGCVPIQTCNVEGGGSQQSLVLDCVGLSGRRHAEAIKALLQLLQARGTWRCLLPLTGAWNTFTGWSPYGYSVPMLVLHYSHDHHGVSRYFWNWNLTRLEGNPWNPIQLEHPVLTGSSCYWWCEAASLTCGWSWDGNNSTRYLVKTTNLDILEYDTLCQHFSRQFSPLVVPKNVPNQHVIYI